MRRTALVLLSILAVSAVPAAGHAVERGFIDKFCVTAPFDQLCPQLPYDQADFDTGFRYMLIEKGAQDPFDVFAWQAFVALNWPAEKSGTPLTQKIGSTVAAPRVWQSFLRRPQLIGPDEAYQACGHLTDAASLLISDIAQSDGSVLVDQKRNFVVFNTFANDVVTQYIQANNLQHAEGQNTFTKTDEISFPMGQLPDTKTRMPGSQPSITMKMAWRILDNASDQDQRYFKRPGIIHIPATRSVSGKVICQKVTLGLVGMHIALRTLRGNGPEWIWATFEHVDNVPVAANARDVNSLYEVDLFPNGCLAPKKAEPRPYTLFDPACPDCATNVPTVTDWRWAESTPFARNVAGDPAPAAQVVRCWEIFESTQVVNRLWAGKLKGTVWANYMLISAQWRGADKTPIFEHGELPRYLTNTTLETFQQTQNDGTCLGCHAGAQTANGKPSNFVFMLRRAQ